MNDLAHRGSEGGDGNEAVSAGQCVGRAIMRGAGGRESGPACFDPLPDRRRHRASLAAPSAPVRHSCAAHAQYALDWIVHGAGRRRCPLAAYAAAKYALDVLKYPSCKRGDHCHVCGDKTADLRYGYYVNGNPVPVWFCVKCGNSPRIHTRPNAVLSGNGEREKRHE